MTLWAGKRDASWYRRPRDRGTDREGDGMDQRDYIGKFHVNVGDTEYATAACGPILDERSLEPALDIPIRSRCQRPGCRVRWPEGESK